MFKNKVYSFCMMLSILALIYIIVLSIFVKTPGMFDLPAYINIAITLLVVFLVYIFYKIVNTIKVFSMRWIFIPGLFILAVIPRLIWISYIHTKPVSDFSLYQSYAVNASKGLFKLYHNTYPIFPFKFGYPLILSIIYRLFGENIFFSKLLNVLLAGVLALLIYWIGSMSFSDNAGKISAILFALWPTQIMYNSVLGAEHVLTLFSVLGIGLLIYLSKKLSGKKKYITLSAIIGTTLAIANFIKPVSLLFFPVIIVYILFFVDNTGTSILQSVFLKIKIIAVIFLTFILSFSAITIPLSKLIGVPLWRSSSGFSLLIGTNNTSSGKYNTNDEGIIKEFNYNYDRIHKEAANRAMERISSHPLQFAMLAEKKFIIQWANEDFGVYWSSIRFETYNRFSYLLKNHPRKFLAVSQFYYITLLIFAVIGCILALKSSKYVSILFTLIFLGFFTAHVFLEVQSRYHYPAIPFLMILSGYGIERINTHEKL